MVTLQIRNQGQRLMLKQLREFEEKWSIEFHPEFAEWLMNVNGGTLKDPLVYSIDDDRGEGVAVLGLIYGIRDDEEYYSLDYVMAIVAERLPKGFFPVAEDHYGNLLLMSSLPEEFGSLFFWDHELETEYPEERANLFFVAESWGRFLEKLRRLEEED